MPSGHIGPLRSVVCGNNGEGNSPSEAGVCQFIKQENAILCNIARSITHHSKTISITGQRDHTSLRQIRINVESVICC